MLSHHTPEKNGGSPLNVLLLNPSFFSEPPPLPVIKEAFEKECSEQRPIMEDADRVALQLPELAPDYRAKMFDSFVFSSLRGPILEAPIIATMLVHPVEERTRGTYLQLKCVFASFVQDIPFYSFNPSADATDIVRHRYAPAVLERVAGGLDYLSSLLERERILSGDSSVRLEHHIHTEIVVPLKTLLSRINAFDGASLPSLDRSQAFLILRATALGNHEDSDLDVAQKAARDLALSTREFAQDHGISLAYLRSSLFSCIQEMNNAVDTDIILPEHRLLNRLSTTLEDLDSFERAAFRKNPTPSSIIQDSDAAARFISSLNGLAEEVRKLLGLHDSMVAR
jgi:hypothetical protein